jgi:rare lipoprotein A (peptidoglycan hydrolase)
MSQKWNFDVVNDGEHDLVATGYATTFNDSTTASGVSASGNIVIGCSLPCGRCSATKGSGFPVLPWYTLVRVFNPANNKIIYAPLIDEGPAWIAEAGTGKPGSAMIDLTFRAAELLGLHDNAKVSIRVIRDQVWRVEMVTHFSNLQKK